MKYKVETKVEVTQSSGGRWVEVMAKNDYQRITISRNCMPGQVYETMHDLVCEIFDKFLLEGSDDVKS